MIRCGYLVGMLAWSISAGAVLASEQGPVSTAPAVADAPPTGVAPKPQTDGAAAQISAWIATRDDGSVEQGQGEQPMAPRAVHGEIGAGVGTNGYRQVYGVTDIPVGQSSDLVVGASDSSGNFGRRGGARGDFRSLSVGLYLNGSAKASKPCQGDAQAAAQDPTGADCTQALPRY